MNLCAIKQKFYEKICQNRARTTNGKIRPVHVVDQNHEMYTWNSITFVRKSTLCIYIKHSF